MDGLRNGEQRRDQREKCVIFIPRLAYGDVVDGEAPGPVSRQPGVAGGRAGLMAGPRIDGAECCGCVGTRGQQPRAARAPRQVPSSPRAIN